MQKEAFTFIAILFIINGFLMIGNLSFFLFNIMGV